MKKHKTKFIAGGLVVLAAIFVWVFGFIIPDRQHRKALEAQLAQINSQLSSTRLSMEETKNLLVKRKAFLEELIKLY